MSNQRIEIDEHTCEYCEAPNYVILEDVVNGFYDCIVCCEMNNTDLNLTDVINDIYDKIDMLKHNGNTA